DLLESDNEDYVKTLLKESFPVPVLPPIRNTNHQTRGGFGGVAVKSRGAGILHDQDLIPAAEYGYGPKFFNGHRDERFVSELKFARVKKHFELKVSDVYFDDRSLRLFKRLITEDVGTDLNEGFDTFTEKKGMNLGKWECTKKGVVYLDVHKLPERPKSELDRRRCYWGYCFESLATEDPRRSDGEGIHHVDANVNIVL
ncbi:hypothetical protein HAX54_005584, partial [Datura stramonium]|nr:hypothetical protein [Datura stramonium]